MFGIEHLTKLLVEASDNQSIILINHIKEQLNVFSGNKSQEDDIVLIAIKIKE